MQMELERWDFMLSYAKLWTLLEKKGMKKTDLKEVISGNTLAKLGKNEAISSTVIEKLCAFLQCQPGNIMEYVSEEALLEASEKLDNMARVVFDSFKESGMTPEQIIELYTKELPIYLKGLYEGESPTKNAVQEKLNFSLAPESLFV